MFLCTPPWPNTFCKRSALNIHFYSKGHPIFGVSVHGRSFLEFWTINRVEHFIKAPTLLRHLLPADPLLGTPSSLLESRPSLLGGLLTHSAPVLLALGGAAALPARWCSRAPGAPVFPRSPARCRPPPASSRLRGRGSPVLNSGANPRFF